MSSKIILTARLFVWASLFSCLSLSGDNRPFSLKGVDKKYLSFLDETYVLKSKDLVNARADVTYMFADVKFREGALKICEFGEAKNSGTAPGEILIDGKVERMVKPYWNLFWNALPQLGLPVWFVGMKPRFTKADLKGESIPGKSYAWQQFIAMGGRHVSNLRALEKDRLFTQLAATKKSGLVSDLSSYKGIIIYVYFDNRSSAHQSLLNTFKKKHRDFLVLDEASWTYAADKKVLAELLSDKELSQYKPKWGVYKKKYTQNLAQKICKDLGSSMFVIKPVNSGRSNGIIITDKNDLDKELRKILLGCTSKEPNNGKNLGIMPVKTKLYGYWNLDRNTEFMVEAYEPSKPLIIKDKVYDPSMRIVWVARHNQGKVYINILGAYWKIPHKSLSDNGTLTEKHKTISVSQPGFTGILVNAEDFAKVKAIAFEAFAKIYAKMIRVSKGGRA